MQQYRTMKPEKILIPIVIAVVIIIVSLFCLNEPFSRIQNSQNTKREKIDTESNLKKQVEAIEEERNQEQENLKSLKPFYELTGDFNEDSLASFGGMLEEIIDKYVKPQGVMVRSIDYKIDPPEDPIASSFTPVYHSCAIELKLISKYSQLHEFLGKLINDFPYFMRISQIIITAYPPDKEYLNVSLTLNLYVKKAGE